MLNDISKKELLSTLKAITGDDELETHFQDNRDDNFFVFDPSTLAKNILNLPLSHNIQTGRAIVDLACAYKLFHDFGLSQEHSHLDGEFVKDFEKIRVLALIKEDFPGCALNILKKIENDVDFVQDELNSKNLSLILLKNILKSTIGSKIDEKTTRIIDNLSKIEPKIVELLKKIDKYVKNQQEFAEKSLEIQKILQKSLEKKAEEEKKEQEKEENEQEIEEKVKNIAKKSDNNIENDDNFAKNDENNVENTEKTQEKPEEQSKNEEKPIKTQDFSPNSHKSSEIGVEFKQAYKIYSAKYDEIINPQKMTTPEDLEYLRLELEEKLENLQEISRKLTLKLKKKLLGKKFKNPNPNDIEGILNRKKLASIIASPNPRNIYLDNIHNDLNDTAITILLDNSGSMRGRPIIMAALACEILAGILENFQIKTEIIGFTTADWKGGRVRKDWEIAGKTENPGRLNELRHIIYKSFNQPFKKAKINLGLMLKEGVLKENIDGEAVLFAKSRLIQREEERKILMVISDGNPIDDSTNLANDDDFLSNHLKQVVANIEKQKQIEICAIGIGHEVGEFYQNSLTIKNVNELGDCMVEELVKLF
ncbi:MAG: hypothetical protein ISQ34_00935 [Rickettsiales bacterium]|nr:hypothetical protein [Rickettsiales bacterium]